MRRRKTGRKCKWDFNVTSPLPANEPCEDYEVLKASYAGNTGLNTASAAPAPIEDSRRAFYASNKCTAKQELLLSRFFIVRGSSRFLETITPSQESLYRVYE